MMKRIDKPTDLKYVVLKDKSTGSIEDICEIDRANIHDMSDIRYFLHRISRMLNPNVGETRYKSILREDLNYHALTAKRHHQCVRITEKQLSTYLALYNRLKE